MKNFEVPSGYTVDQYLTGMEQAYEADRERDRSIADHEGIVGDFANDRIELAAHSLAPQAANYGLGYIKTIISQEHESNPESADVIWDLMSPEQQEWAHHGIKEMAEKFGRKPEEFQVFLTSSKTGANSFVAALKTEGIDKGSWDDIFDPEKAGNYVITVGGEELDTRESMTDDLYRCMVATLGMPRRSALGMKGAPVMDKGRTSKGTLLTGMSLVKPRPVGKSLLGGARQNPRFIEALCGTVEYTRDTELRHDYGIGAGPSPIKEYVPKIHQVPKDVTGPLFRPSLTIPDVA